MAFRLRYNLCISGLKAIIVILIAGEIIINSLLLYTDSYVKKRAFSFPTAANNGHDGQNGPTTTASSRKNQRNHYAIPTDDEFNTRKKTRNLKGAATSKKKEPHYHIVFSTDCSAFQKWQSYVLFYHAMRAKQPGTVTRIASGCNKEESIRERQWHEEYIEGPMSNQFKLHLTPSFSAVMKDGKEVGNYKFFNKPFGLLHWLENSSDNEVGFDEKSKRVQNEDAVVILIDPDMVLLRPITMDFSNGTEAIFSYKDDGIPIVTHGKPFGQKYGYGSDWMNFNMSYIAGKDSPANLVSEEEGGRSFPAGPPYIATAKDMYNLATKWSEFVPKVHEQYPELLAEMYAYSAAAAHLELPHRLLNSLMISNPSIADEGWSFIDKIPSDQICEVAYNRSPSAVMPNTMHYCQRYMLEKWFWGKRRLPTDFLSCESPLLKVPPMDIALRYDYRIPPPPHKPPGERKHLSDVEVKRHAFGLCTMISALNEAGSYYKKQHCKNVNGTRFDKSLFLWDL